MAKAKALVLLSGGLDSMLAVKVLQAQKIEVEALSFVSNFYSTQKAEEAVKILGIKLHIVDIKNEMLELVKNPPSGYGKNLNPCIDCHAYMLKRAGEFLNKDFSFVATGEVLGQRPFSQNSQSLREVTKLSGIEVLRPLSAKLLPETKIEKSGLVKRHKLLNIEGRSRYRQIELAEKYGIRKYPSPAGGCLLTDPGFSSRLGKMLDYWPECSKDDIDLLKNGRVYWFKIDNGVVRALVVVGRHKADNNELEKLVKRGDFVLELKKEMGPFTVVRIFNAQCLTVERQEKIMVPNKLDLKNIYGEKEKSFDEILRLSSVLTGYYATKLRGKEVEVVIKKIQ